MNRRKIIMFASIWLLFIVILIPTVVIYPTLNSNLKTMLSVPIIKDMLAKTNNETITSFNQLNNFVFSYGGVHFVCTIASYTSHAASWGFFIISEVILLPIISIITLIATLLVALHFILSKVRLYKLRKIYQISIILAHTTFYAFFMSLFFGLLFVSIFWSYSGSNMMLQKWYGPFGWNQANQIATINDLSVAPESFNLFGLVMFRYQVSGMFSAAGELANYNGLWCLQAGFIFLFVIQPFFLACYLVILQIRIISTVQVKHTNINRSISNFTRWLVYINISSKKEFRKRVKSNVGLLMVMVTFIIALLFPAFAVHSKFTLTKGMILLTAVLLLTASSTPIYYVIHSLRTIKQFSYNKLLFFQMVLYTICGFVWQLVMWVEFKAEYIKYHDWVAVLTVGLYLISCYIAFVLLVRGYR